MRPARPVAGLSLSRSQRAYVLVIAICIVTVVVIVGTLLLILYMVQNWGAEVCAYVWIGIQYFPKHVYMRRVFKAPCVLSFCYNHVATHVHVCYYYHHLCVCLQALLCFICEAELGASSGEGTREPCDNE